MGRELFEKGYQWRVGNGFNINIASNPWINWDDPRKQVFTPNHIRDFSVAWLMMERDTWNVEKVRDNFIAFEVDKILQISIPSDDMDDVIIWGEDKKALFSVKSAYHLGMQLQEDSTASSYSNSVIQTERWKRFWKGIVAPKIKHSY